MKTSIKSGAILKCDYHRCKEQFVSYSISSYVRRQAIATGWARVFAWQITKDDSPRIKKDVCPEHAVIAKAAEDKRAEIVAERRAEDKAKRDLLRKAKADVVAAERSKKKAEREAARNAKAEIRRAERDLAAAGRKVERDTKRVARDEQKKIDRAQRRADKLSIAVHGAIVHVATAPKTDADTETASESGAVSPYPVGGA